MLLFEHYLPPDNSEQIPYQYSYYDCFPNPVGGQSIVIERAYTEGKLVIPQYAIIIDPPTLTADELYNSYTAGRKDEFTLLCEQLIPTDDWFYRDEF